MLNYAALVFFTLVLTSGQVFFKLAAPAFIGKPLALGVLELARTPAFYAGITLYGAATLLWVWILSRVPLSQAYPWVAIATVAVPLLASQMFDERVNASYWLGVAFVVLGVVLTQRASPGGG
jgi:drug/metabolite transporter (DMT)-like permease